MNPTPGYQSTEIYVTGAVITALATAMTGTDPNLRIVAAIGLTLIGIIYITLRSLLKLQALKNPSPPALPKP
jgi:hypothetical protein